MFIVCTVTLLLLLKYLFIDLIGFKEENALERRVRVTGGDDSVGRCWSVLPAARDPQRMRPEGWVVRVLLRPRSTEMPTLRPG